jgi:15-hydroxyprostaglandin dehydrogenase (NAD)
VPDLLVISSIETNPQYGAAKYGVIGLVRSAATVLYKQDKIALNAICPAMVMTNLTPENIRGTFPQEHFTPMSTIMRAYDSFLDDDALHGQTVIASVDKLHFEKMPRWADDSLRWIGEESSAYWEAAYKEVAKARTGI